MIVLAPCARCGDGADVHRLEGTNIDGPTSVDAETAEKVRGDVPRVLIGPFRCTVDGCGCPDYVDEPLVRKKRP